MPENISNLTCCWSRVYGGASLYEPCNAQFVYMKLEKKITKISGAYFSFVFK